MNHPRLEFVGLQKAPQKQAPSLADFGSARLFEVGGLWGVPATGPLPLNYLRFVRLVCLQAFRVLAYLHTLEPPVVHGDIKPNNLLLRLPLALAPEDLARELEGEPALVKRIDFGLQREEGHMVSHSHGAGHFLAPEAFLLTSERPSGVKGRRGRTLSAAEDLWTMAFSLSLFLVPDLTVWRSLLISGAPWEDLRANVRERLKGRGLTEEIADVWSRMLAPRPTERPSSLEALERLEKFAWWPDDPLAALHPYMTAKKPWPPGLDPALLDWLPYLSKSFSSGSFEAALWFASWGLHALEDAHSQATAARQDAAAKAKEADEARQDAAAKTKEAEAARQDAAAKAQALEAARSSERGAAWEDHAISWEEKEAAGKSRATGGRRGVSVVVGMLLLSVGMLGGLWLPGLFGTNPTQRPAASTSDRPTERPAEPPTQRPATPTAERPAEPAPTVAAVEPSPSTPKAGDRQTFQAKGVRYMGGSRGQKPCMVAVLERPTLPPFACWKDRAVPPGPRPPGGDGKEENQRHEGGLRGGLAARRTIWGSALRLAPCRGFGDGVPKRGGYLTERCALHFFEGGVSAFVG